jgi:protein-S-isoprenylcysteine O-methyltransferase Ste14
MCYEPIWSFVAASYINYNSDNIEWHQWLDGNMVLLGIWGGAILILTFIYMLASVGFGLRFSNLTNRGIITNGVYAWCKHPAYVSKNLSWWLIAVPFVLHDKATAFSVIRDCAALLALNGIYFLRARTEERHLSSDPTYVAYALAMNERSIFAPLARAIPFLRYTPGPVLVDLKEYQ